MRSVGMRIGRALQEHPERLLYALIAWQLSVWVVVPALVYTMVPLDTLEAIAWGKEWQWGYYKHPPLGAWLAQAAVVIGAGQVEAVYVLAQLVLVACLLYVWQLALRVLDPVRAVLATTLLAGSYFHSVLIPNFNMNTLQLPLWAGMCFHLLRALDGRRQHWWPFALLSALAVLAKYSSVLLLASCVLVILGSSDGRRALRDPVPWLAALLGLLILAPHLHWLIAHDFLPLRYLAGFQQQATQGATAHVLEPLRFAFGSLLSLSISLLLFGMVVQRGAVRPRIDPGTLILLVLTLGPMLLTCAYGVYSGSRLKSTWAFPFYSLAGILLFRLLPTKVDARRLGRFAIGLAGACLLILGLHFAYKVAADRSKTGLDGEQLAQQVNCFWRAHQGSPLPTVAANHVLSAIVAAYAPDHPRMLIDGDMVKSPWLDTHALRAGAVVVCPESMRCLEHLGQPSDPIESIDIDGHHFTLRLIPPQR